MSNIPDNNPLEGDSGEDPFPALQVEINVDAHLKQAIDQASLLAAARQAAAHRGFTCGQIGLRVTDDAEIQRINRRHLDHDYPTDVISFGYSAQPPNIDGELVVSVDTAAARAAEMDWSPAAELMLYVVHGTLHLTGMDDHQPDDRAAMRQAETEVMLALGIDQIVRCGADMQPGESSPAGSQA